MLKTPRIRVRRGLLREDLAERIGNFEDSISAEFTSNRKVVLRNIANDDLMSSQQTEPDFDMVSMASSRLVTSTPIPRTEVTSQSSLEAWALACRNEADAAVIFSELEERRARSTAALAAAALVEANKLAVAAEEARRKAAVACNQAKKAKISAQEAADFAVRSLETASKAEEAAVEFHFLHF